MMRPDTRAPQDAAASLATASFAQDVVVATSKAIHGQALDQQDRAALERCRRLLSDLTSTEIALSPSSERGLASSRNALAALRAARQRRSFDDSHVQTLTEALERLLAGASGEDVMGLVSELREIFLLVGQANLRASATRRREREQPAWTTSSASLNS